MKKFENKFNEFLNEQIRAIKDPFIKYCFELIKRYSNGGKRLRPKCLELSYRSQYGKKDVSLIAIALELHHTYTLILDDIMDEDDFRRNKSTIHKELKDYYLEHFQDKTSNGLFNKNSDRFAVNFAILISIAVRILSKKAIFGSDFSNEKKIKIIELLETTDEQIYQGQSLDLMFELIKVNEDQYLEMIKLKTAVLFGLCFELGAYLAESDEYITFSMKEIGIKMALSFQIQDDVLDLIGKKREIGSDIKKGKKTLLMIKTLERADESQKRIISQIFGSENIGENAIKKIIQIMKQTGALTYCQKLAQQQNTEAKKLLSKLDIDLKYKTQINEMIDYMVDRTK